MDQDRRIAPPVPRGERRLVRRRTIDQLEVSWTPPKASRLRRHRNLPVRLVDLSITGATVRGTTVENVRRGIHVTLHIDGNDVAGVVRSVRVHEDDCDYGIEFGDVTAPMRELLIDIAEAWAAEEPVDA